MDAKSSCYYKSICSTYQRKFVPSQLLAPSFRDICNANSKRSLPEKYCPMHELYTQILIMAVEELKGATQSLEKFSAVLKKTDDNLEQKLV